MQLAKASQLITRRHIKKSHPGSGDPLLSLSLAVWHANIHIGGDITITRLPPYIYIYQEVASSVPLLSLTVWSSVRRSDSVAVRSAFVRVRRTCALSAPEKRKARGERERETEKRQQNSRGGMGGTAFTITRQRTRCTYTRYCTIDTKNTARGGRIATN